MSKKRRKSDSEKRGVSPRKCSPERDRKIADRVRNLAEPLCETDGLELVHVEYQQEARGRIMRIYIDRPGGVTLDNCVSVSRQMGDILDVSMDLREAYHLEVSSPGPDRPLARESDFIKFQGHMAEIRTITPISGKKKFKGPLADVSDGRIGIIVEGQTVQVPFQEISRARLVNYNGEDGC
ncbi:ribosome maturation factor RimP [Desulfonema ishimotonii]|uniref:Ribosome maturation factor RimP n=1 Tax=Desulfonema ishimotonii TaxID=45657 RepID=A0A401G3W0_9BACT|nr:ribosome maturation factor RimP [Desulfonema ishimotonii]GBC63927.1 ribosome maturation factor RimP [Desulfonema ishimotonii]